MRSGMITIVRFEKHGYNVRALFICDCGKSGSCAYGNFNRGLQLSCGCNRTPKRVSYDYSHPLYHIWVSIKGRCYNENDSAYYNYGARGVTMCDEWVSNYQNFYDWCILNGWKRGLHVDKDIIPKSIGVEAKEYSPKYCSIITRTDNNRQRRGVKVNMDIANDIRKLEVSKKELSIKYGVSIETIYDIINKKTWV
jgi:hypothetical protein